MVQYLSEKLVRRHNFVTEAIMEVRSTAVLQVLLDKGLSLEAFSSRLRPPTLRYVKRELTAWQRAF